MDRARKRDKPIEYLSLLASYLILFFLSAASAFSARDLLSAEPSSRESQENRLLGRFLLKFLRLTEFAERLTIPPRESETS